MIQNVAPLASSSPVLKITGFQPGREKQPTKPESQFTSAGVILNISREARELLGRDETTQDKTVENSKANSKPQPDQNASQPETSTGPASDFSPEAERLLQRLRQSDLNTKTHEHQHIAAAGGFVKSGPVYEYTTGPDGKRYAVGGHVSLDMSPIPNNPEATIRKAQVIKRAALAPADPSGADRAVAAAASKMELKAREQLRAEQAKNMEMAVAKGRKPEVAAYTKPNIQTGQSVNFLL